MTSLPSRRTPVLDARLSAAMDLAGRCHTFADIGADHGRLSAVMLLSGQAEHGVVADISEKALEKARQRIHGLGLDNRVTFAVADGLTALKSHPGPVDAVFILGMGGDTISGILHRESALLQGAALIISPQTEASLARQALCDSGYRIRQELIAHDHHRDYLLLRSTPALPDEPVYTQEQLWLGPVLMQTLPPNWLPVLERRKRLLSKGVEAMRMSAREKDRERLQEASWELACVNHMLSRMDCHAQAERRESL